MKKLIFLIIICQISIVVFSQTSIYEKFGYVETVLTPYVDKIDMQVSQNKIQISEADWIAYRLNKLEEYDTEFKYNVYGIVIINELKFLLIERKYREESNRWAIYISEDGKILSYLNIAYENSEGFLYIESEIDKSTIKIKETNQYADPVYSETLYSIDNSGFNKK